MTLNEENVVPKLRTEGGNHDHTDLWYLDNRASNHMTGDRSMFHELDEKISGKVKFADGSTVEIRGKGSMLLQCKNGDQKMLPDIYFILSLCNNILSLGQLAERGCKVVLQDEFLRVYDKNKDLLMKVKRSPNRLYKISLKTCKPICVKDNLEEPEWDLGIEPEHGGTQEWHAVGAGGAAGGALGGPYGTQQGAQGAAGGGVFHAHEGRGIHKVDA